MKRKTPQQVWGHKEYRIAKLDIKTIDKVAWKIARGLFYFHTKGNKFLPENTIREQMMYFSKYEHIEGLRSIPKEILQIVFSEQIKPEGSNFDFFRWKIISLEEGAHFCFFFLWDYWLFIYMFHDPDCRCEKCLSIH